LRNFSERHSARSYTRSRLWKKRRMMLTTLRLKMNYSDSLNAFNLAYRVHLNLMILRRRYANSYPTFPRDGLKDSSKYFKTRHLLKKLISKRTSG
jgi:hypothetical protein